MVQLLQAKRKQAEEVVFPKRTVNMAEFAARLEENNKMKKENLEAKRLQREVRTSIFLAHIPNLWRSSLDCHAVMLIRMSPTRVTATASVHM